MESQQSKKAGFLFSGTRQNRVIQPSTPKNSARAHRQPAHRHPPPPASAARVGPSPAAAAASTPRSARLSSGLEDSGLSSEGAKSRPQPCGDERQVLRARTKAKKTAQQLVVCLFDLKPPERLCFGTFRRDLSTDRFLA